jgi:copper chaperone CopZ
MKQTLKIKGMHCKSCKMLIEDALEEIDVKSNVNVEAETIELGYDESKISLEKIKSTIKAEGDYEVE